MKNTNGQKPGASSRGQSRQAERNERLSKALRENLKRRKEQARGRKASGDGGQSTDSPDSSSTGS